MVVGIIQSSRYMQVVVDVKNLFNSNAFKAHLYFTPTSIDHSMEVSWGQVEERLCGYGISLNETYVALDYDALVLCVLPIAKKLRKLGILLDVLYEIQSDGRWLDANGTPRIVPYVEFSHIIQQYSERKMSVVYSWMCNLFVDQSPHIYTKLQKHKNSFL